MNNILIKYREIVGEKFQTLLTSCRNLGSPKDIKQIKDALRIAIRNVMHLPADKAAERINEELDIAIMISREIGLGRTSIICTLLYDTFNSDQITLEDINKQFGSRVANISRGLKQITKLKEKQGIINSENFRKLLLGFAEDIRVQLIFLAEKLYMLRKCETLSEDEKLKLADETNFIYIPIAHRLGLYNLKSEMEERALRITMPETYADIERKLKDSKSAREAYIQEFAAPIRAELDKRGVKYHMKARTKTIASILNKIRTKHVEFEDICDIFAIRFIIDSKGEDEKPDCWKVYSVVTDIYHPNPERLRDWLSVPKSNGYESLHATVLGPQNRWVEVQIRTERMDEIAERGFAAHWKYKGGSSDMVVENWLNELREILESKDSNAIDLLDDMQIDLHDKEVHVFTPKGDLVTLHAGATLLDFAYSIHSNLGAKCVGGIVNQRNETLKYVLKNGDQISITTSPNQQPKADWLNFTVTTKARNKIRQFLNEQANKLAEIGKEALMRRIKNWKMEFNDDVLRKLMLYYKYKYAKELYQAIGEERYDFAEIKEILTAKEEVPQPVAPQPQNEVKFTPENRSSYSNVLLIDKTVDSVEYKFAKCCNPVYGDDIVGFVSIGEGIKVHRTNCKNVQEMMRRYPYRFVKTQWTNKGGSSYQATLKIVGSGSSGIILTQLTELVSKDSHVSMRSISVNSTDGGFDGSLTIMVSDSQHLDQFIARVRSLKGIIKVSRQNG
ncbi:MAG: bifunctional (p)ppGpp synthetase/guanosine-3',5'-bis(diphosphate) 3'-pyrophosphohydrolase [Marinifilaceae bacterium]|nr:bifunctional (p)ppGpp synthetase/guanosine-3',5'-bis(diphosphate) 3'-pyrophosphohydrolase [Marinifilaceae bacterium]